jgi:hypothetical protein
MISASRRRDVVRKGNVFIFYCISFSNRLKTQAAYREYDRPLLLLIIYNIASVSHGFEEIFGPPPPYCKYAIHYFKPLNNKDTRSF